MDETRELWLYTPDNQRVPSARFRAALGRLCRDRGWGFSERTTRIVNTPIGRIRALDVSGANELYRRIHRANVGIATVADASVPSDPRSPENGSRTKLSNFVRYKAFLLGQFDLKRVTAFDGNFGPRELDQFNAFAAWTGLVERQGEDDPRYLPMHVFAPGESWSGLDFGAGRDEFRRVFGAPRARTDRRRLTWARPSVLHTAEPLMVAGELLRTGFHWDVSLDRGGPVQLVNHSAVWRIERYGHINVHPDAFLRRGQRCECVWPKHQKKKNAPG